MLFGLQLTGFLVICLFKTMTQPVLRGGGLFIKRYVLAADHGFIEMVLNLLIVLFKTPELTGFLC